SSPAAAARGSSRRRCPASLGGRSGQDDASHVMQPAPLETDVESTRPRRARELEWLTFKGVSARPGAARRQNEPAPCAPARGRSRRCTQAGWCPAGHIRHGGWACSNVEMIGVRGSGESYSGNYGMGTQIAALYERVKARNPGSQTLQSYGLG